MFAHPLVSLVLSLLTVPRLVITVLVSLLPAAMCHDISDGPKLERLLACLQRGFLNALWKLYLLWFEVLPWAT